MSEENEGIIAKGAMQLYYQMRIYPTDSLFS